MRAMNAERNRVLAYSKSGEEVEDLIKESVDILIALCDAVQLSPADARFDDLAESTQVPDELGVRVDVLTAKMRERILRP